MDARKILSGGVLTYIVFGIVSLFQLGVFLPPFPLKPTLLLAVTLLALALDRQGPKGLRLLFGGFMIFYAGSHSSFWELFLGYEQYANIQEEIESYFLLIAAILLPIFNYLFLLSLINSKRLRLILHLLMLFFVPFFVIAPNLETIDLALIGMAIVYFLVGYSPFFEKPLEILHNIVATFITLGLINMIDRIVYMIY